MRRAPTPSGDPPRGLLIVLEGIDGSGKSEQARALACWLRERGEEVVETREPTGGPWGLRYRAWARGETRAAPEEVLRFFIEDRREHVAGLIRPSLGAGRVVVCDRYVDSTLAYQAAQGLSAEALRARMQAEGFPRPDLTIWLRLDPSQALARLRRGSTERFERVAFLERVDAEYARLGLDPLDAGPAFDQVAHAIRERVRPLLEGR